MSMLPGPIPVLSALHRLVKAMRRFVAPSFFRTRRYSQSGERSCTVFSYPTIRAEPLCGQVNYKGLDEDERKLLKENLIILQDCECSGVKFAVTLRNIIEDWLSRRSGFNLASVRRHAIC